MIDYICPSIALIVFGYLVYQYIVNRKKINEAEKINADYKNILDSKLIPLGFERSQRYEDVREKEISYKRNTLEITLNSALFNEIYATSGKKITLEERMPPEIRKKTKFENEQDKYRLVDALDFKIELSESEEVKTQFLRTLEKWLTENLGQDFEFQKTDNPQPATLPSEQKINNYWFRLSIMFGIVILGFITLVSASSLIFTLISSITVGMRWTGDFWSDIFPFILMIAITGIGLFGTFKLVQALRKKA